MNEKLIRSETSLSFFDESKEVYVYGLTVPKSPLELATPSNLNYTISSKFVSKDNILKIKIRNKKKLVIEALIEEQR